MLDFTARALSRWDSSLALMVCWEAAEALRSYIREYRRVHKLRII